MWRWYSFFCIQACSLFLVKASFRINGDPQGMKPIIIGIGGGHSGAGKTTVACEILKKVEGWGAIKFTKTSFYNSITDDRKVLSEKGKDTGRLLGAGAEKVLWVQSSGDELSETASMAVQMLSNLPGIVVEGNSMIEVLTPDIVIFVAGSRERFKPGAEKVLGMADIVITDEELPQGLPERTERFHSADVESCIEHIVGRVKEIK
jgi:molybdopterin-guanine dinucleotide biosynthesis protein